MFSGAIHDSSHSYNIPFYAAAAVGLLGAFITSFIRMFDNKDKQEDNVEINIDGASITGSLDKCELVIPGDSRTMEIIDSKLTVV